MRLARQDAEGAYITLISEEDGAHLVKAKVHMEGTYQRQQDTILSWHEPETGLDYALSFQEPEGCTEVWEQICALQGRSADDAGRGGGDGLGGDGSAGLGGTAGAARPGATGRARSPSQIMQMTRFAVHRP